MIWSVQILNHVRYQLDVGLLNKSVEFKLLGHMVRIETSREGIISDVASGDNKIKYITREVYTLQ